MREEVAAMDTGGSSVRKHLDVCGHQLWMETSQDHNRDWVIRVWREGWDRQMVTGRVDYQETLQQYGDASIVSMRLVELQDRLVQEWCDKYLPCKQEQTAEPASGLRALEQRVQREVLAPLQEEIDPRSKLSDAQKFAIALVSGVPVASSTYADGKLTLTLEPCAVYYDGQMIRVVQASRKKS